jgi:putative spermidine/putrescine transport system ATP-binding protein
LLVTHDQEEALSVADRVGVMRAGGLEQLATPAELYEQPATAFVAGFVGSVNRLAGRAVSERAVEVLGARLPTPPTQGMFTPGERVEVLLRPEAIRLVPGGSAVVTGRSFLGALMRIGVVQADGTPLQATVPALEGAVLAAGTPVTVELLGPPLFLVRHGDEPGPEEILR